MIVHIIQEVTNWTGKPVVLLKALDAGVTCTSKQKSMNASEIACVAGVQGEGGKTGGRLPESEDSEVISCPL